MRSIGINYSYKDIIIKEKWLQNFENVKHVSIKLLERATSSQKSNIRKYAKQGMVRIASKIEQFQTIEEKWMIGRPAFS